MSSKSSLPRFIEGKTIKVTQKMYDSIEKRNGFKLLVAGYNYSKIKDFGDLPIEMVNPADGNKKYVGQKTMFPKGMFIPAGSVLIEGSVFSKNTHIGNGCSISGGVFNNGFTAESSCKFTNCVSHGPVNCSSSTRILGNCTFRNSFKSLSDCVVSGINNNFLSKTMFGHNLKMTGANLYGETIIGNNPVVLGSNISGSLNAGARVSVENSIISTDVLSFTKGAHFKGNTTFEKAIALSGAYLGSGVVLSSDGNKLSDCIIASGIDIPNETILNRVQYNKYHKGKNAKRGLISDNCEIINSTIVNSDIGRNVYFSNSEVSYSKIDSGVYDGINKNKLDNVTFVDSSDPDVVVDLTEVILSGHNKTNVHININVHDTFNVDCLPVPSSGVEVVVNALYSTGIVGIKNMNDIQVDGLVSFSGQCEFKEFNDLNQLAAIDWLEYSDICIVPSNVSEVNNSVNDETEEVSIQDGVSNIVDSAVESNIENNHAVNFKSSFIEDVGVSFGEFNIPGDNVNTAGAVSVSLDGIAIESRPTNDLPPINSYDDCDRYVNELEESWNRDAYGLQDEIESMQKSLNLNSPSV